MNESRRDFDWDSYLIRQKKQRIWRGIGMGVSLILLLAGFWFLLGGRHYLLTSLVMIGLILGVFFYRFEGRKPRAREIVLLATMTTFCVVMNEICAHTIPLHAGTTMVVISGIALGPEAGFLVGALSRLVCNIFDGQGPWTPWEMVAWGMLGYLAGLAFNKVELRKKGVSLAEKLSLEKKNTFQLLVGPLLCVGLAWLLAYLVYLFTRADAGESFFGWRLYLYGVAGLALGCLLQRRKLPVDLVTTTIFTFITVFLLYGGLMNFAGMLLAVQADPSGAALSWDSLKALYLTGVPYDVAHAGTAALCMFLFGDSILQKVQRIQIKFGILL